MDEEIRQSLDEEILNELQDLGNLDPGSEEHSRAIDSLTKLYKIKIEEVNNAWDNDEKYNRRLMDDRHHESEEKLKKDQLAEQIKDRYFRLGIEVAGIVLPLIFYAAWMRRGFKFEESGTFTSTTFKGLFQKFRPTRK